MYDLLPILTHIQGLGVSPNSTLTMASGYRVPCTSVASIAFLTSESSSWLSLTFSAPRFSSKYLIFLVPGIGITSSSCASSKASASCPGVIQCFLAISSILCTSLMFFGKFSAENLGANFRKSPSSKSSGDLYCPVRMPRPSGLYATIATPSSLQVSINPIWGSSISIANGLYST